MNQHLISPYNNTAESFIKIMKIKEMITELRNFDRQKNSVPQEMYREQYGEYTYSF